MMKRTSLAILRATAARLILLLVVLIHWVPTTRAGIAYWEGNGHYYEVVQASGGLTWLEAQDAAALRGGYLATVTSADENAFVFSLIDSVEYWSEGGNTPFSSGPWIGGHQMAGSQEPGGGWGWITGETWSFTAWAPGEPNNGGIGGRYENAVLYWTGASAGRKAVWNDYPDEGISAPSYIVEWDVRPVPEPSSLLTSLSGLIILTVLQRRRLSRGSEPQPAQSQTG